MAITVNPYADRAAAQMAVQQQNQPVVEQPYNLFAQQKQAGYPGVNTPQAGPRVAGEAGIVHSVPITEPVAKTAPVQYAGGGQKKIVPITNTDELAAAMGYTSPEEEERLRKASVANQRILAVGDALRHIGNIANTVNYAPAQQFNNPVAEEQARYEKGKALRDKANLTYLAYQQQKAAQDAKQKQWEADYNLKVADAARKAGYTEAQIKNMQDRLAQQKAYNEGNLALRERLGMAQQKERERHNKVAERQGQQRIGIASQNAKNMQTYRQWKMNGGGGTGSAVAPLDTPKGRITPNGKSYGNQLLQMFDYAKSKGYVQETDVAKRLRELGFGKDQSDNVKRQMVMDLLRTNQDMGDYASSRLGWSYSGGSDNAPSIGWDDDEDEADNSLEIGW